MLKSIVAGMALGAFGMVGAAEAAIVTVSYSGRIGFDGYDTTNYFGAGPSLQNQDITLTYVFDTSKGVHTNSSGIDQVSNGSSLGEDSPAQSVSVTINKTTFSFAGLYSGAINASDAYGYSMLSQSAAYDKAENTSAQTTLTAPLGAFPNSITSPLNNLPLGGSNAASAFGNFSIYNADPTTGYDVGGSFYASSITVSSVPLPSALPLFGLALAGLGTAAAFRKRQSLRASR